MKKINILKKKLGKQLIKSVVIILVMLGLSAGMFFFEDSTNENLATIQKKFDKEKSDRRNKTKEYEDLIKALALYENIRENRKPTESGLHSSASRIRATRDLMEELREEYKFAQLDATLSTVDYDENYSNTSEISVINNQLNITFSSSTDARLYAFLYDLITKIPGYLELSNFKIERKNKEISDAIEIQKKENNYLNLVEGKASFFWRTLKSENRQTRDKTIEENKKKQAR